MFLKVLLKKIFENNPLQIYYTLSKNKFLIWQITRRNITMRFRGSFLGIFWTVINPLVLLAMYTVVFGYIFQRRSGGPDAGIASFSIFLFSGLIVFQFFSACMSQAVKLIRSNSNYVTKVVFPLEVLPWTSLFTNLFYSGVSWIVLLIFYLILNLSLNWTIVFLPLIILPLLFMIMGFSWLLASLGVYVRDVGEGIGVTMRAILFMTPILYPIEAVPEKMKFFILYFNPLTMIIGQFRDVIIYGNIPDFKALGIFYLFSIIVAWLGLTWFQLTREGFADVI